VRVEGGVQVKEVEVMYAVDVLTHCDPESV
jgi:hypothetical protein